MPSVSPGVATVLESTHSASSLSTMASVEVALANFFVALLVNVFVHEFLRGIKVSERAIAAVCGAFTAPMLISECGVVV